jgi:hypothetical protein
MRRQQFAQPLASDDLGFGATHAVRRPPRQIRDEWLPTVPGETPWRCRVS